MSQLFHLLDSGAPSGRHDALLTPQRRHRSVSPSPRVRVAWCDMQPSSSPHEAGDGSQAWDRYTASLGAHTERPVPTSGYDLLAAADRDTPSSTKENIDRTAAYREGRSAKALRARRRSRRSASGPYAAEAADSKSCAGTAPALASQTAKEATSPESSRRVYTAMTPNRSLSRTQSDPLAVRLTPPLDTTERGVTFAPLDDITETSITKEQGSDDSFSRLVGDDSIDAAAFEELAEREGW